MSTFESSALGIVLGAMSLAIVLLYLKVRLLNFRADKQRFEHANLRGLVEGLYLTQPKDKKHEFPPERVGHDCSYVNCYCEDEHQFCMHCGADARTPEGDGPCRGYQ